MAKDMLAFAKECFAAHGIAEMPKRLSGGWTNHVFTAGGWVLRCTQNTEGGRLRRETGLARLLPEAVGYPQIQSAGTTDGCDWVLCKRIEGTNLEDAWEKLDWEERASALEQLWQRAKCVHRMDKQAVRPYLNDTLWYFTSADDARAEADTLLEEKLLDACQCRKVKAVIRRFEEAMPQVRCVPVHGDLTPANAIWYEGKTTALIDFECAVIAPVEADLMMLIHAAYGYVDCVYQKASSFAEQQFRNRLAALLEAEHPNPVILRGFEVIKLMHHVYLDRNDADFSADHEDWNSLRAVLQKETE